MLIVDDNTDAAEMLSTLLEFGHHQTAVANDGSAALAMADSFSPDTMLHRYRAPADQRQDVCRQIRSQPWGKAMTLIAVTGWGRESDKIRAREAGFDHHLVKPIEHDALLALLASLPLRSSAVQEPSPASDPARPNSPTLEA
ncbi:MAG: response regulator [Vicinamibacterales bacterium]